MKSQLVIMKEIWYRADFDYVGLGDSTDEYHCIKVEEPVTEQKMKEADEKAIAWAKDYAKDGADFSDEGHVELDLVQVTEVDGDKECFPEIRTVWY